MRRTVRRTIILGITILFFGAGYSYAQGESGGRAGVEGPVKWSTERAWQWYKQTGVIRGCNYLPRSATNSTEMWQEETFDPETIDQELGWAQKMNYNSVRVFIQYLVWQADPQGFIERLDTFLKIADKHKIRSTLVLFDDCAFGYPPKKDPYLGPQGDPEPGEYCPYWTPSPGHSRVADRTKWPALEKYVKSVVGSFKNDRRILMWDLYNEAGNSGLGDKSLPLVQKSFAWARGSNPCQPLTACWLAEELCDVITFHSYSNAASTKEQILKLQEYGRPIINTEWLLRRDGNTVEEILPVFARHGVGWYHWGLVAGRTQTFMLWHSKKGDPIPENWQHDIFHPDGKPYRPDENELLSQFAFDKEDIDLWAQRWSAAKARKWHQKQPWLRGCNFLPSTAVNSTEMWQEETFDPETIDRELGWAKGIGFNTVRVFVQYIVWEADAWGLKNRMEQFLEIADRHGISVMYILFDDCFKPEPHLGKQEDPIPGVHNSQWTSSPGEKRRQKQHWPELEKYVKDIIGQFSRDERVFVWDLYNEPKPSSLALVEKVFLWARQAKPVQPITVGAFSSSFDDPISQRYLELSDVSSFHSYDKLEIVKAKIKSCEKFNRPIFCTEWMARPLGSRIETHLPLFKKYKIGCYSWGLVAGRIQTYMPWGSKEGSGEPKEWFHDIFRKDGSAYNLQEIELFKNVPDYVEPKIKTILATSVTKAQTWKYTTKHPAPDWMGEIFDDSQWLRGPGGFGTSDTATRKARTKWDSSDIWLRREFELSASDFTKAALVIQHDEDAVIYINGQLAVKLTGYNGSYELVLLDKKTTSLLKQGKNTLAVHCRQTAGGQYIDVGLAHLE